MTANGRSAKLFDMIKAVIYARVSTKDQEREGYSIPAQLELLRTYARRHKIEVVREFLESDSAGKAGRKQFGNIVTLLQKDSSIKVILVEKTDRLYLNFKDRVLIDDLDVEIHFVKDGRVIGKNSRPSDKFAHDIETAQARFYLNNLSEEVKKGQRQKARQGSYPGGAVPLGYMRNKLNKSIELDPERTPVIRTLFEMYAQGDKSIDNLHEFAKLARLTYPRSDRVIARSEIERMLKKVFYTGKFYWNDLLYQGDHPTLVNYDLFERVQNVFKCRTTGKFSVRNFMFSRLITCGECGNAVTAEIKKEKYIYYHCTGYGNKHKRVYVPEAVFDREFSRIVGKVTLPYDWYDYLKACLQHKFGQRKIRLARERERLELARDKIQTNMKKAFQAKLDGVVSDEFFKSVHNDYQRELDAANYRLANLSKSIDADFDIAMKTIELSHQAESLYLKANPDQKRRLLKSVLSNCYLKGATLCPIYSKPFDILVKGLESQNMRRR